MVKDCLNLEDECLYKDEKTRLSKKMGMFKHKRGDFVDNDLDNEDDFISR
jgi:hypothetical protein